MLLEVRQQALKVPAFVAQRCPTYSRDGHKSAYVLYCVKHERACFIDRFYPGLNTIIIVFAPANVPRQANHVQLPHFVLPASRILTLDN